MTKQKTVQFYYVAFQPVFISICTMHYRGGPRLAILAYFHPLYMPSLHTHTQTTQQSVGRDCPLHCSTRGTWGHCWATATGKCWPRSAAGGDSHKPYMHDVIFFVTHGLFRHKLTQTVLCLQNMPIVTYDYLNDVDVTMQKAGPEGYQLCQRLLA